MTSLGPAGVFVVAGAACAAAMLARAACRDFACMIVDRSFEMSMRRGSVPRPQRVSADGRAGPMSGAGAAATRA